MAKREKADIDWTALSLPTDSITVGDIRRRHLELFKAKDRGTDTPLEDLLAFETLATEMDLAQVAFDRTLGRPDPLDGHLNADDLRGELVEQYARLGIGEGEHSRQTLARRIEQDATAQAKPFKSPGK